MKIKRWIGVLLCALLCVGMLPTIAFAEGTKSLTVNGTDALTTSSGEGWTYDDETGTLTLDGYQGGSIIAGYMDLTVVLAEGSENIISTSDEYGIANVQEPFSTPYYELSIIGSEGSTLNITASNHAVSSKGDIFIQNLNMTAKNTTSSTTTGQMECISSEADITIENSVLDITTETGVGITCYDYNTISGSDITVKAGMIGIHANNENLKISDSTLNVSGGMAALYSSFGTVSLTNCGGELTAGTASIYAENKAGKSETELVNCELDLIAPYGVMTYSGILIQDGLSTFDCTKMGIFAYSANYNAVAQIKGNAEVNCTENTPQLMRVDGSYTIENTADVTGVILENTGNEATMCISLVGDVNISSDTSYGRNILIPTGANVTVSPDITWDISSAPSVTIEGTLTNSGILKINGGNTNNKGSIYNYGEINMTNNEKIVNSGTIYSICSSDFDLSPYAEHGIILHIGMACTEAVPATHLTEGNTEYWYCDDCGKYFSDEAGTKEIDIEDTVVPKLTEHTVDKTGWHSDETSHWNTCECGEKLNKAAHTFTWVTDKEATATEKGSKHKGCTVCGYAKAAVEIPATGRTEKPSEPPTDAKTPTGGNQTDDTTAPETGDDRNIALWIAVMLASGTALTSTVLYNRKRKYSR